MLDSVSEINNLEYFNYLRSMGNNKKAIPVVSIERRANTYGIASVVVNNIHGGSLATKHLIDCGCRNIANITGPLSSSIVQDRLSGYKDELIKEGLEISSERIVEGDYSPLSGYHAMKQILLSGIDIDGLFAANDQMAIGAIKAIKENGLRIPEDMKVVGFDNSFIASIVEPSLTTINVPKYKMGNAAAEVLIKRIETDTKEDAKLIELPISVIVRQSTNLRGDRNWDLYGW